MGKGGASSSWEAYTPKPAAATELKPRDDFLWDESAEPHASRRRQIMKAHPEVTKLFGHEWRSKYICLFLLVIPQIWLSWATTELNWPAYLFVAYVFGATITQALFLAIHELAHNLFFKSPKANRYFAMVANWPIGIPYCVPFRGYHLEHHKWQGIDGIDTDIPSRFEGKYIRGPVSKTVWACCQILTYALRPMFIKAQDVTSAHLMNWASQIAFDLVIFHLWGWRPLFYLVLCIFLAGGLHPCAGHFISEHYVFPHLDATQETYSYCARPRRALRALAAPAAGARAMRDRPPPIVSHTRACARSTPTGAPPGCRPADPPLAAPVDAPSLTTCAPPPRLGLHRADGVLNWLTWNVGYHNEHHDFCNIPWSRLPALKALAPEFYDSLAVCDSWVGVIWDYIMRPEVGPYNRVKRHMPEELRADGEALAACTRAKAE